MVANQAQQTKQSLFRSSSRSRSRSRPRSALEKESDSNHLTLRPSNVLSIASELTSNEREDLKRSVSHFHDIGKHIQRLPQFHNSDEFFQCLSNFTSDATPVDLSRFESQIFDAGTENCKYEVILENQRGATAFGIPLFSKKSLLFPLDPPTYQTLKGSDVNILNLYPLPGRNWAWAWDSWHVLMINDVDEEGWMYSNVRFGSRKWKGVAKFGNFVRRRVWVRLRVKTADQDLELYENVPPILIVNPMLDLPSEVPSPCEEGASVQEEDTAERKNNQPHINVVIDSETCDAPDQFTQVSLDQRSVQFSDSEARSTITAINTHDEVISSLSGVYNTLLQYKIDRLKVDEFTEFLFATDTDTLQFLITDYNKRDMDSWLSLLLSTIEFDKSKKSFLSKFETRLNELLKAELQYADEQELLVVVSDILHTMLADSFYDSEKRK
ncbi:hypothetical protein CANARDRAFT_29705 [[Candida] arabinofermentans NRRL YB-2248]|uniref:Peroxin/Ferlin domain-containing protein n=1 Tax=[Candida] arabinofermentans NRRL YB-2248 TaxID=983967 RepID=A0A1E4SW38_9ASCO|nr:hypothetical protein CANARDRAFT_29705 [[Candida] arabinofermentans NRRL YB-2248]